MTKKLSLQGMRFERLEVLYETAERSRFKHVLWLCRCDCGKEVMVAAGILKAGNVKSCGCLHRDKTRQRMTTHGQTGTPTHNIWLGMIKRCTLPNSTQWPNYGGRGITVCDRWKSEYMNFLEDMGPRPAGMTIERKDNDKGYSPDNCVWLDNKAQSNNKRTNRVITYNGECRTVSQWAAYFGLKYQTMQSRLRRGWTMERIEQLKLAL